MHWLWGKGCKGMDVLLLLICYSVIESLVAEHISLA